MRLLIFLLVLLLSEVSLVAQQEKLVQLKIIPFFSNTSASILDTTFQLNTSDSIRFETVKFYVSAIELYRHSQKAWKEKNSFHLIDAAQEKSNTILLNIPKTLDFDSIRFNIGIDSNTNSAGVLGGDLDPTKGMYWTWQSGYINVKLEGTSNLVHSPNHAFEFHLGGYMAPFETIQNISRPCADSNEIKVYVDLKPFITSFNLQETHHVMSPNADAVKLSKLLTRSFFVK